MNVEEGKIFLIAEAGVNHEGSMTTALEMVRKVADAGWDAIKFQSYTADTLASIGNSPSYWDLSQEANTSQHQLFSKYPRFTKSQHSELKEACNSSGIEFLTTFFDVQDLIDEAETISLVKIASADLTNTPLIRAAALSGKPIIMSVGAGTDAEIRRSVELILNTNPEALVTLLHCVLNYPTQPRNAFLFRIGRLIRDFSGITIGYSDHTQYAPGELNASALAVAQGAKVIEKHFTLDRSLPGNDHYHSADFEGLVEVKRQIQRAIDLMGDVSDDFLETQSDARTNARRRLCASRPIQEGQVLNESNLIPLRANNGLEVELWDSVMGLRVTRGIQAGQPVHEADLEQ